MTHPRGPLGLDGIKPTPLQTSHLFPNVCLCKEWESGSISKGDIHQKDALFDCTGILLLLMAEILQHLVHVKSY